MGLSNKPYKGCRDFFPIEMRKREFLFQTMKTVAHRFGYEPYDGPMLEEVELYLAKSGEELINEQIYSFIDRGERKVAIRPEMTPTVARMVSQVHREVAKPLRWYSIPNLMRYEKPQKGRLREHWQLNCDIFGAPENLGELEILEFIVELMKEFGANEHHFGILINDRQIVDAVFKNLLTLTEQESYKLYKVIDKAKKVSPEALDKMISEIISVEDKKLIFKKYLQLSNFDQVKKFISEYNLSGTTQSFYKMITLIEEMQLSPFITYDPTIVRGLDYYTGIVFEVFDKHPENRRAIAGGGSYANLLQIFGEPALPGVGFGMGDVTLTDFLEVHKLMPNFDQPHIDVLVCYTEMSAEIDALLIAKNLRIHKIKTETYLGEVKPKKAFGLTDKKGHHFVIFIGSNELTNKAFEIKNLKTREAKSFHFHEIAELAKYIQG
jgi:histidyl-tRNA synthetase